MTESRGFVQFTTNGTILGQDWVNVYYYRESGVSPSDLPDMIGELEDMLYAYLRPLQTIDTSLLSTIATRFLESPAQSDLATAYTGQAGTDSAPPFASFRFTMLRSDVSTRNGAKRFPGVSEAITQDGIVTDAPTVAGLTALGVQLAAPLISGLGVLEPIIVKRILEVLPGGQEVYRLPQTLGEAVYNDIAEVLPSVRVTTQNTRKF